MTHLEGMTHLEDMYRFYIKGHGFTWWR